MSTFSIQQHNNFLKGVSDFFEEGTDSEHRNFCKKHKIEHIGKTAYSIGIDLYLYETFKEEKYYTRAYNRVFRVISKLTNVEDHYVYLPDGNARWNMSQRVIDAGAATDMIATFLYKVGYKLTREERHVVEDAIKKSADTYLTLAAVHKAPTNQRLWGATGLASAYRIFNEPTWEEALRQSVTRSLGELRADGSFPYITAYKGYADHTYKDVTPFYHSRHAAYMWHVLDVLEGDHIEEKEKLVLSTDFLIGLYQGDGKKNIELETKHWYFLSDYEISSNSYDAYAFLRALEYTKNEKYAYYASTALQQLYEHQLENGALHDHKGRGINFQCQHFWNGNTAWIARLSQFVEKYDDRSFSAPNHALHFEPSGIVNVKNEQVAFMVRGSKVERNATMGPKIGGGSLVYVGNKESGFKDILGARVFGYTKVPGNFHVLQKDTTTGVKTSKRDFKILFYYALIELRALSVKGFIQRMNILWREAVYSVDHVSSMFVMEVPMRLNDSSIWVESALANRLGKRLPGYKLERSYILIENSLTVKESITCTENYKILYYVLPRAAKEVIVKEGGYRRKNTKIYFEPTTVKAVIEYKI